MAAQDERFRAQHGSEKGQEEERGCELSPSQHACAAADGAESLDDEREAKLKHLARRSKTATMALGRERSKSAQLSAELVSVRRQLADAADGGDSDDATAGGLSSRPAPGKLKDTQMVQQPQRKLSTAAGINPN